MARLRWFVIWLFLPSLLFADSATRHEAILIKEYNGSHQEQFTEQFDRVRLLVRQAQLEASARLGLMQYQEGFQYPLTIRFEDGAPRGIESALAYVRLYQSATGFGQELVVNLEEMAKNPADFDQVFTHEMTHAVLNDAVGGEASMRIPHWVQEGLAQFISQEGDARVEHAAQQFRRSQVHALLYDLEGPYSGYAYPQYYLAIKYMHDKFTVNAVQALVRDLIAGQAAHAALEDSTGIPWDKFQLNLREYSLSILKDKAKPDF